MDFLIELLSLPIFDYISRVVIVLVVYLVFKDFIVDTWSSWTHGGFKVMSTNFLKMLLIIVAVCLVLGFGLPTIARTAYDVCLLVWDKALKPLWDLIRR